MPVWRKMRKNATRWLVGSLAVSIAVGVGLAHYFQYRHGVDAAAEELAALRTEMEQLRLLRDDVLKQYEAVSKRNQELSEALFGRSTEPSAVDSNPIELIGFDYRNELSPNFMPFRPEIQSLEDFRQQVVSMKLPPLPIERLIGGLSIQDAATRGIEFWPDACDWFARAFSRIRDRACYHQSSSRKTTLPLLSVRYTTADSTRVAYAVRATELGTEAQSKGCATLVIPGSGKNPVSAVLRGDDIYRDLTSALEGDCDVFVFAKEGHDFLALHRDGHTADEILYTVYLLALGGSYSATYITDAAAVTLQLKKAYDKVYVAGVSQGGLAALIVSLLVQPDGAIVSSGWSVVFRDMLFAGLDQIILPGFSVIVEPAVLFARLKASKTRFLFTYGRKEQYIYLFDAQRELTCNQIRELNAANVSCVVHGGGHVIPTDDVHHWMARYAVSRR